MPSDLIPSWEHPGQSRPQPTGSDQNGPSRFKSGSSNLKDRSINSGSGRSSGARLKDPPSLSSTDIGNKSSLQKDPSESVGYLYTRRKTTGDIPNNTTKFPFGLGPTDNLVPDRDSTTCEESRSNSSDESPNNMSGNRRENLPPPMLDRSSNSKDGPYPLRDGSRNSRDTRRYCEDESLPPLAHFSNDADVHDHEEEEDSYCYRRHSQDPRVQDDNRSRLVDDERSRACGDVVIVDDNHGSRYTHPHEPPPPPRYAGAYPPRGDYPPPPPGRYDGRYPEDRSYYEDRGRRYHPDDRRYPGERPLPPPPTGQSIGGGSHHSRQSYSYHPPPPRGGARDRYDRYEDRYCYDRDRYYDRLPPPPPPPYRGGYEDERPRYYDERSRYGDDRYRYGDRYDDRAGYDDRSSRYTDDRYRHGEERSRYGDDACSVVSSYARGGGGRDRYREDPYPRRYEPDDYGRRPPPPDYPTRPPPNDLHGPSGHSRGSYHSRESHHSRGSYHSRDSYHSRGSYVSRDSHPLPPSRGDGYDGPRPGALPVAAAASAPRCDDEMYNAKMRAFGFKDDGSAAPSPSSQNNDVYVDIGCGVKAKLRRTKETMDAIAREFYAPATCFACCTELYCIADAKYIVCPICKTISPAEAIAGPGAQQFVGTPIRRDGVGLGFTPETLNRMQAEVAQKRGEMRLKSGF